jgi:hypothetical protein
MRYKHPIRQIVTMTRGSWDRPETRAAVRASFDRMTKCGTLALGAEVFASETEKKIVPHTCKARPCPSCGHRATIHWQRELWCALPDIPFTGIVFTMPDVLNFNSHLHILVSAGGLQESEGRWINSLIFDEDKDKGKLMRMWRFAVITYLRAALEAKYSLRI